MNDPNALDRLQRKTQLLQDRVTLLEEENAALAGMLRERGVDVHRPSHIHVDLPAALTEPAAGNAAELALMSGKEKKLFEELSTGDAVLLLLLSEAMVDVGRWFWRSRLWLYATPTELVAFAAGRHAFVFYRDAIIQAGRTGRRWSPGEGSGECRRSLDPRTIGRCLTPTRSSCWEPETEGDMLVRDYFEIPMAVDSVVARVTDASVWRAALTEIAGSSAVLDRGFVTYSNEAKREILGVPPDILETFGAVSVATAWAMARPSCRAMCSA